MSYDMKAMPLVPLRSLVLFPNATVHLEIGRDKSIAAIEAALSRDRIIVTVTQSDGDTDEPMTDDLYRIGTLAKVKQVVRLPGGVSRVMLSGISRVSIDEVADTDGMMAASVTALNDEFGDRIECEAYRRMLQSKFIEWISLKQNMPDEAVSKAMNTADPADAADRVAFLIKADQSVRQSILEELNVNRRLARIIGILDTELEVNSIETEIHKKVREQMEKAQKDYFLREKIRAMNEELGVGEEDETDSVESMREKLATLDMPEESRKRIEREIKRFTNMAPTSPEASICRNYLEYVLGLPWNDRSDDRLDIRAAETILEEDHYGLEKIKERILEFLAVRKLSSSRSGTILCLAGPPGVGKTSLAKSVARALNRKFVRVSMGGVSDEAEVRGHRRAYLGALPGRMLQGLKTAGTKNPVFLLDEIDKIGRDYKGDPSSALLELLDPEQNHSFSDHYLEVPFDFSEVFWITTANYKSNIQGPLLDRLDIVDLSSYLESEKVEIAKRFLVPKQEEKHGLPKGSVKLSDAVLRKIISSYTNEAGVRTLEKRISMLCRKLAYAFVTENPGELPTAKRILKVTTKNLETYLGAPLNVEQARERTPQVGLACGLAWTSIGGVVLPCEATVVPGTGKMTVTGSVGKVMQESSQAAMTYIRRHAAEYGLEEDFHKKNDVHVHLPEGGVPKDGPSAGITMTLAVFSAFTDRKIRNDVAMTGEITLRGRVLPIGGLREKLFAALRYGIKEVFIPHGNLKDLDEIPESAKNGLVITPVKSMDEVLEKALV